MRCGSQEARGALQQPGSCCCSSVQPLATCSLFHQTAQVKHRGRSTPPTRLPQPQVGEDVGLIPPGMRSRRPGFDYSLPFGSPTAACLLWQGAGWVLFWRCFKEKACTTDPISACECLQHACQVPQFLDLLRALMLDSSSSR